MSKQEFLQYKGKVKTLLKNAMFEVELEAKVSCCVPFQCLSLLLLVRQYEGFWNPWDVSIPKSLVLFSINFLKQKGTAFPLDSEGF